MRSTRFRTLDHTVLSVPNADFFEGQCGELPARRNYHGITRGSGCAMRRHGTGTLHLVEVRKSLYAHPRVVPDPAGSDSWAWRIFLDLDVFAYIDHAGFR
jgi:hypothetical protein